MPVFNHRLRERRAEITQFGPFLPIVNVFQQFRPDLYRALNESLRFVCRLRRFRNRKRDKANGDLIWIMSRGLSKVLEYIPKRYRCTESERIRAIQCAVELYGCL